MSTQDTEFAAASPRRSILFVALSPEEAGSVSDSLKVKRRRWRLEFAPTTTDALTLLRSAPFDAVVMNLQTRGIDPVRFFKEVMDVSPEALRVGVTADAQRRTLQDAGTPVHQFLAKPLDPKVLTAVLARAFAAQDFLSQEHFRRLIDSIQSLPVMPTVYLQVMEELNSSDPSPERLGQIVATDMALSARMLQIVNSAYFGLARPIGHPGEAVMFLGTETVKALILSLGVFSQFSYVSLKQFNPDVLWQHSWSTGALARRLCEFEETERSMAEEAFMAGLLHDMGKLVLAANYPALLEQNIEEAQQKKIGLWEQEFLVHGSSHAEMAGYLLRRWGMPAGVVDAVTFHHRPTLARIRSFSAVTAVHLANTLPRVLAQDSAISSELVDVGYLRTLGMEDRLDDWKQLVASQLELTDTKIFTRG